MWCQRSDGVNVTGAKLQSLEMSYRSTHGSTHGPTFLYIWISLYIWLNAAQSVPVLFLFPRAELNQLSSKKLHGVSFFNSVWITWICTTISDYLNAQKGICKHCHDSKWISFHSSEKAVTWVILAEVFVAGGLEIHLEWISLLFRRLNIWKQGRRVDTKTDVMSFAIVNLSLQYC